MRFFRTTARVGPAHPAEAAVLAELYRRAWTGCDRLLNPLLVEEQTPPGAEVTAWFRGGFEVFRTRHDGRLVGAVRCCFPSSACNVDRLVVDPDARGRGVGHMLLEHAVGRARRAGVTTVILPKRNEKDLEDVPANVRTELQFHFVETIDEVLDIALEPAAIPVDAKPQGFQQATVSS